MQEMEIPDFLQNNDEDAIHDEIFALIPDEYDKSENQHYWNFTRPTARVVSQLRGFNLPEAIKLIFPQFSHGEYLELHAQLRNFFRKEAIFATGKLLITGTPGTVIPAGYMAATEARNDIPSKDYATTKECVIGEDGTVEVEAIALTGGMDGNTAANTIIINASGFDDVTAITNEAPFTGGVEEEKDEALYERIHAYDSMQGNSNIGNPTDYKRWAEEVPGTGTARVVRAKDNSGLVTIILTDGNGEPASEILCQTVYDYILSPDNDDLRKAPCGANLSVISPETTLITIAASVKLSAGTVESITTEFVKQLKLYLSESINDKEVRYQKVCNVLGDIPGVYDFTDLTINGGTANITFTEGTFPTTDTTHISLTKIG